MDVDEGEELALLSLGLRNQKPGQGHLGVFLGLIGLCGVPTQEKCYCTLLTYLKWDAQWRKNNTSIVSSTAQIFRCSKLRRRPGVRF